MKQRWAVRAYVYPKGWPLAPKRQWKGTAVSGGASIRVGAVPGAEARPGQREYPISLGPGPGLAAGGHSPFFAWFHAAGAGPGVSVWRGVRLAKRMLVCPRGRVSLYSSAMHASGPVRGYCKPPLSAPALTNDLLVICPTGRAPRSFVLGDKRMQKHRSGGFPLRSPF